MSSALYGRDAQARAEATYLRARGYSAGHGASLQALDDAARGIAASHPDLAALMLRGLVVSAGNNGQAQLAASARARLADLERVTGKAEELATPHERLVSGFEAWRRGDAKGSGRPFEAARTHLVYGEWLRREKRRSAAAVQLTSAVEAFDKLGAITWAERATAELAAVGQAAARAKAPGVLARLTPQEYQIVMLAARGLSNREIAARLFLSHRTVGYHLYKAYPKLDVCARAQLAALIADQAR